MTGVPLDISHSLLEHNQATEAFDGSRAILIVADTHPLWQYGALTAFGEEPLNVVDCKFVANAALVRSACHYFAAELAMCRTVLR